ncbi:lipopolysaccharide assembly protein LapA domain-containing protein [Saccharomonospora sp. NB11]|jgi:putative membrane protein|uniref:lipopolysaccharide assembly protein LapA domain-containing protein n=1 Tax=Saccharomonospora sp. NB11 TaxID=1642298 RepID=UPI0018D05377|nr:lipopolysaccharide assembly protein LapA domain-containing protein [Saccharomonospora sp. NB11]
MSTDGATHGRGRRGGNAGIPVTDRTRIGGAWVGAIVATVLLVVLLVFILQNTESVTVRFLGTAGSLPLGVSMLLSAVVGALVVAALGVARIVQLRRTVRRRGSRSHRDHG